MEYKIAVVKSFIWNKYMHLSLSYDNQKLQYRHCKQKLEQHIKDKDQEQIKKFEIIVKYFEGYLKKLETEIERTLNTHIKLKKIGEE